MPEIVKVEIANSIQAARGSERSLHFAESSKHRSFRVLLAKLLQFLENTSRHRNLPRPIGFGVYRANVYDPLLEVKIRMLKCEQLVSAQPGISGDDDDWPQMGPTTLTISDADAQQRQLFAEGRKTLAFGLSRP